MTITIHAPAKLNLDLRIVGRRADGYHNLRTLFQSIALHDTVRLSARPGPLTVRGRTRALPRDRANLVWKAADILWSDLGRRGPPSGVSVSITKAIPRAGGLGGGSSDAASALRGLCALWKVSIGKSRLSELAARVGSDVPYFLTGGLVLGVGRGERLRPLPDLGRYWVVLAVPQFGVVQRAGLPLVRPGLNPAGHRPSAERLARAPGGTPQRPGGAGVGQTSRDQTDGRALDWCGRRPCHDDGERLDGLWRISGARRRNRGSPSGKAARVAHVVDPDGRAHRVRRLGDDDDRLILARLTGDGLQYKFARGGGRTSTCGTSTEMGRGQGVRHGSLDPGSKVRILPPQPTTQYEGSECLRTTAS